MYANKEDALNDENVLDTQTTNKQGYATFENDIYYGRYIKESKTIENYQIRDKEKDIIPIEIDNGVRFLGEMTPKTMKFAGKDRNGQEVKKDSPTEDDNINTYLQHLVEEGKSFNENTNWLVFNDNGTEKLVAKKPLKHTIAWINLKSAGLVFGQKEKPSGYTPTEITMNGKKYIVRLMRTYNEKIGINDNHDWSQYSTNHYNATKGGEWNRLILPLIDPTGDDNDTGYANGTNGRYSSITKKYVERNMPTLANYSWWTDFGGNNDDSGGYRREYDYGVYRWVQETGYDDSEYRAACRGNNSSSRGAAYFGDYTPNYYTPYERYYGWQPVLELVN